MVKGGREGRKWGGGNEEEEAAAEEECYIWVTI